MRRVMGTIHQYISLIVTRTVSPGCLPTIILYSLDIQDAFLRFFTRINPLPYLLSKQPDYDLRSWLSFSVLCVK